jgi:hypothetical protein
MLKNIQAGKYVQKYAEYAEQYAKYVMSFQENMTCVSRNHDLQNMQ